MEKTGVAYRDIVSVATEVFETPAAKEDAVSQPVTTGDMSAAGAAPAPMAVSISPEEQDFFAGLPTLHVAVGPTSRLVFMSAPDSLAVEKLRFLAVRLREMRQMRPLKRVLITSTIPEEGKSLVAANLAGVLARKKEKILLIEGDMRRPVLAQQFGLGRLAGLAEWLQNGSKPANIYRLEGPNLWLMPAGEPPERPLELMQTGKLNKLIQQLSGVFDWIVIDSPPVLPLADTSLWARLADGSLLVTREGITQKAQLERGLEIIKKHDLLGVILNSCSDSDEKNYYQRYSPGKK